MWQLRARIDRTPLARIRCGNVAVLRPLDSYLCDLCYGRVQLDFVICDFGSCLKQHHHYIDWSTSAAKQDNKQQGDKNVWDVTAGSKVVRFHMWMSLPVATGLGNMTSSKDQSEQHLSVYQRKGCLKQNYHSLQQSTRTILNIISIFV